MWTFGSSLRSPATAHRSGWPDDSECQPGSPRPEVVRLENDPCTARVQVQTCARGEPSACSDSGIREASEGVCIACNSTNSTRPAAPHRSSTTCARSLRSPLSAHRLGVCRSYLQCPHSKLLHEHEKCGSNWHSVAMSVLNTASLRSPSKTCGIDSYRDRCSCTRHASDVAAARSN